MATVGERNQIGGVYQCSRCNSRRHVNQMDFFPVCPHCNMPGMKWINAEMTALVKLDINRFPGIEH